MVGGNITPAFAGGADCALSGGRKIGFHHASASRPAGVELDSRCRCAFWSGFAATISVLTLLIGVRPAAAAESFDCLVVPVQSIELASPVPGLLERVHVARGDRVRKGQVLVELESSAEKAATDLARFRAAQVAQIKLAEAKLEFAQRRYERRRDMAAENLMSAQERDDAEAEFKLADAELRVAKENQEIAGIEYRQQSSLLAQRSLSSPFDGIVVDQIAFPGEVVEPSGDRKGILKLAQLDPLRVQIILPKEAFGRVTTATPVAIRLEIGAAVEHTGRVRAVDRLVDAASGTFVAQAELPNPTLAIPAGVKCKAKVRGLDAAAGRTTNPVSR